jgi:uncharacterized membrane protein
VSEAENIERLEAELAALRRRVEVLEAGPVRPAVATGPKPPPLQAALAIHEAASMPPPIPVPPLPPPPPSQLELEWESIIGVNLANRLGVVTLLLAAAFFLKYVADQGFFPPALRVLSALVSGIGLAFAGWRLHQRGTKIFAQGLAGAGAGVAYAAVFAAFSWYYLIPSALAFAAMVLVTAGASVLAVLMEAPVVAILSFLGAYATPLLLSDGFDRPWVYLPYLLSLATAGVWLALRGGLWRGLQATAALSLAFFALWQTQRLSDNEGWIAFPVLAAMLWVASYASLAVLLLCAAGAMLLPLWQFPGPGMVLPAGAHLLLLLVALAGLRRASAGGLPSWSRWSLFPLAVGWWAGALLRVHNHIPVEALAFYIGLPGLLLFSTWPWHRGFWLREEKLHWADMSAITVAAMAARLVLHAGMGSQATLPATNLDKAWVSMGMAALFACVAVAALKRSELLGQFFTGLALLLLALAAFDYWNGPALAAAWALEAMLVYGAAWKLQRYEPRIGGHLLCLAALLALAISPESRFLTGTALGATFWCGSLLCAAIFLGAQLGRQYRESPAMFVVGHLLLLGSLQGAWARAYKDDPRMLTLGMTVLTALYGGMVVAIGAMRNSLTHRYLGLALLGFALLKLYVNDVWELSFFLRFVAFGVLGGMLLGSSWLFERFKHAFRPATEPESTPTFDT